MANISKENIELLYNYFQEEYTKIKTTLDYTIVSGIIMCASGEQYTKPAEYNGIKILTEKYKKQLEEISSMYMIIGELYKEELEKEKEEGLKR